MAFRGRSVESLAVLGLTLALAACGGRESEPKAGQAGTSVSAAPPASETAKATASGFGLLAPKMRTSGLQVSEIPEATFPKALVDQIAQSEDNPIVESRFRPIDLNGDGLLEAFAFIDATSDERQAAPRQVHLLCAQDRQGKWSVVQELDGDPGILGPGLHGGYPTLAVSIPMEIDEPSGAMRLGVDATLLWTGAAYERRREPTASATVSGSVVWARKPLAGAGVQIKSGDFHSTNAIASTTTDASGAFSLRQVPAGTYYIYAVKPAESEFVEWTGHEIAVPPSGTVQAGTLELLKKVMLTSPPQGMVLERSPVEFAWEAVSGAVRYQLTVHSDTRHGQPPVYREATLETRHSVTSGLKPDRYQWGVSAFDREGQLIADWSGRQFTIGAPGAEDSDREALLPGSGVTLPALLSEVKPSYPRDVMDAGVQGVVVLDCDVEPDGSVGLISVSRGLHPKLDDAATKALKQWRFRPGVKDGRPVRVRVTVEISFWRR